IELLSIVDSGTKQPAIYEAAFVNTPSKWFWASTPDATDANKAWVVDFEYGYARTEAKTTVAEVRCVRYGPGYPQAPAQPIQHYVYEAPVPSSGSVIRDQYTGVHWWNTTLGAHLLGVEYSNAVCSAQIV